MPRWSHLKCHNGALYYPNRFLRMNQGSPVASSSASAPSSSCSEPSVAATLGNLPHEVRLWTKGQTCNASRNEIDWKSLHTYHLSFTLYPLTSFPHGPYQVTSTPPSEIHLGLSASQNHHLVVLVEHHVDCRGQSPAFPSNIQRSIMTAGYGCRHWTRDRATGICHSND